MTTIPPALRDLSTASFRPRWELGAALAYMGTIVAALALEAALYELDLRPGRAGIEASIGVTLVCLGGAFVLIRRRQPLAGGLLAFLGATAAPWIVAGLTEPPFPDSTGFLGFYLSYPAGVVHGSGSAWIAVDATMLAVAVVLLVVTRFALLALLAVVSISFLSRELATVGVSASPYGGPPHASQARLATAAFAVAALLLVVGCVLDRIGWRREAFWPHLGAALVCIEGLLRLLVHEDHDVVVSVALAVGLVLIATGVLLRRSAYGVVGGAMALLMGLLAFERVTHVRGRELEYAIVAAGVALALVGLAIARWRPSS